MNNNDNSIATQVTELLNLFIKNVSGALHIVLVTSDGLMLCASDELLRDLGDEIAALTSGFLSLSYGACKLFSKDKEVRQLFVELKDNYFIVMPINSENVLACYVDRQCDLGSVGYEMVSLINRLKTMLSKTVCNQLRSRLHISQ